MIRIRQCVPRVVGDRYAYTFDYWVMVGRWQFLLPIGLNIRCLLGTHRPYQCSTPGGAGPYEWRCWRCRADVAGPYPAPRYADWWNPTVADLERVTNARR